MREEGFYFGEEGVDSLAHRILSYRTAAEGASKTIVAGEISDQRFGNENQGTKEGYSEVYHVEGGEHAGTLPLMEEVHQESLRIILAVVA